MVQVLSRMAVWVLVGLPVCAADLQILDSTGRSQQFRGVYIVYGSMMPGPEERSGIQVIQGGAATLMAWSRIRSIDVKPSSRYKDANGRDVFRTEADVILTNGKRVAVVLADDWATKYGSAVLLHGNAGKSSIEFKDIRQITVLGSAPPSPTSVDRATPGTSDIYMRSGQVMQGADLKCGPRGYSLYVKSFMYTTDFTIVRNAEYGPHSDQYVDFNKLSRIDFSRFTPQEQAAIDQNKSYRRWVLKGDLTFRDGKAWKNVYLLDICYCETEREKRQLSDVEPAAIVFH